MSDQQEGKAEMCAITISREYGSGGGEIARRLAAKLDWQLVDHEVVVRIAHALGVGEQEVALHDEYADSLVTRILCSMRAIDPTMMSLAEEEQTTDTAYHRALVNLVQAAVQQKHEIIVGRGAQVILADRRDVLHVRIVASLEKRIVYVMQREGLDRNGARERINHKERARERYMQMHFRASASDPHLYDLVLNTDILALDSAVELIHTALVHKAARQTIPEHELGPAAEASPYVGVAEDFVPPGSRQDSSSNQ